MTPGTFELAQVKFLLPSSGVCIFTACRANRSPREWGAFLPRGSITGAASRALRGPMRWVRTSPMSKTHGTGRSLSFSVQVRAGLLKLTYKLGKNANINGYTVLSSKANPGMPEALFFPIKFSWFLQEASNLRFVALDWNENIIWQFRRAPPISQTPLALLAFPGVPPMQ